MPNLTVVRSCKWVCLPHLVSVIILSVLQMRRKRPSRLSRLTSITQLFKVVALTHKLSFDRGGLKFQSPVFQSWLASSTWYSYLISVSFSLLIFRKGDLWNRPFWNHQIDGGGKQSLISFTMMVLFLDLALWKSLTLENWHPCVCLNLLFRMLSTIWKWPICHLCMT